MLFLKLTEIEDTYKPSRSEMPFKDTSLGTMPLHGGSTLILLSLTLSAAARSLNYCS
jgi:hypothetical protein